MDWYIELITSYPKNTHASHAGKWHAPLKPLLEPPMDYMSNLTPSSKFEHPGLGSHKSKANAPSQARRNVSRT